MPAGAAGDVQESSRSRLSILDQAVQLLCVPTSVVTVEHELVEIRRVIRPGFHLADDSGVHASARVKDQSGRF
jgi:hypothetical protein